MPGNNEHPAQKESDEAIVAAVQRGCDELAIPAVPTKTVSQALSIDTQATYRRLDRLAETGDVGAIEVIEDKNVRVWYVPEEKGGVVDTEILEGGVIDFDRIDLADIPLDKAEEIAEMVQEQSPIWQRLRENGDTTANVGLWPFVIGFGILVIAALDRSLISFIPAVEIVGAVFFVGGGLPLILGIAMGFVGRGIPRVYNFLEWINEIELPD